MGFFDKSSKPVNEPISIDRYKRRFDANDINYGIDDDGDAVARFDNGIFWFMTAGPDSDVIHIRARWIPALVPAQMDQAVALANEFNGSHLLPRCYVVQTDEDTVLAFGDLVVDATHGVSDDQLDMHLSAATETCNQFFTSLNEAFPELAATIED